MQFIQRLRSAIRNGEITTSIRIWQRPRVKVGNYYAMQDGFVRVNAIQEIGLGDITPRMARDSGFSSVVDLLKVAKHGHGMHVYLVRFQFVAER